MMNAQSHRLRGLTLIELAVLLGILLLLVALVFPVCSTVQPMSLQRRCMSRARAIAASTRTYASKWDGWTHPDPCHFVKEFGYKLNSEPGYSGEPAPWYVPGAPSPTASQTRAARATDFTCPLDEALIFRAHGMPTSYQLGAYFCGRNVLSGHLDASRVLIGAEVGRRHPKARRDEAPQGHYVYADLHAELGYHPP